MTGPSLSGEQTRRRVLAFIAAYIEKHGYSPSVRDICRGVDINSTSQVSKALKMLKAQGAIEMEKNRARTVRVVR